MDEFPKQSKASGSFSKDLLRSDSGFSVVEPVGRKMNVTEADGDCKSVSPGSAVQTFGSFRGG